MSKVLRTEALPRRRIVADADNYAVTARSGGRRAPAASTRLRRRHPQRVPCYRCSLARSALKDTATVSTTFIEPIRIEYGLMPIFPRVDGRRLGTTSVKRHQAPPPAGRWRTHASRRGCPARSSAGDPFWPPCPSRPFRRAAAVRRILSVHAAASTRPTVSGQRAPPHCYAHRGPACSAPPSESDIAGETTFWRPPAGRSLAVQPLLGLWTFPRRRR